MIITEAMKVLIIEDDSDIRESLIQTLEGQHFIVDAVAAGQEGLYRAMEWKYDAIILDIMLPELSGWEILQKLRQAKLVTPVLMLTALDEMDDRIRGLDGGADDFLTKPFSMRELIARLRALHRRATRQSANAIEIGSVLVDTAKKTVSLHGEPVTLTAAQYRIVAYLASRAGQLVSRAELEEAIVGEESDAISNVIDVQIHHIRRKLGKEFVQNRRGLGYIIPNQ